MGMLGLRCIFLQHSPERLCYDGVPQAYTDTAPGREGRPLSWAPSADAVAGGDRVDFVAVVDQVIALLRQWGRVSYRTL